MKYPLLLFIAFFALSACQPIKVIPTTEPPPEPTVLPEQAPKVEKKAEKETAKKDEEKEQRTVVGQIEYVYISPENIRQQARIDTGAKTTSVSAIDIEHFERDGKKWVQFYIYDRSSGTKTKLQRAVERTAIIKRHNTSSQKRPVVLLTLTMGKITQTVEVNLVNRENYQYPYLIGRNFLDGHAIVDVSKKFITLDDQEP